MVTPLDISEKRKKDNENMRKYRETNKERLRLPYRIAKLKSMFGITLDQYNEMLNSQNGVCKICGKPSTKKQRRGKNCEETPECLSVDHDHITGKIRGLLCYKCNTGIGKFDDDPIMLQKAADYIRENQ
jgi:hypothetical protein